MLPTVLLALGLSASANAAPMQLNQQGRLLDGSGSPLNTTTTLVMHIRDGGGVSRYDETFDDITLADGYYGVVLGGDGDLQTSVFLDWGAMSLEVIADGVSLSTQPLGGYPVVVAQQSLLATEASVQQLIATTGLYSETCDDFASRGWASEGDCLTDGRWHLVYDQATEDGAITALRNHIDAGASVRVVTTAQPAAWDCVAISYMDRSWGDGSTRVACHGTTTSHPGPHNQHVSGAYWSTYELWSSGQVYYTERTGGGSLFTNLWHGDANGKWYIKY